MDTDRASRPEGDARCIVLLRADAATDDGLRSLLAQRGWRPATFDDPYLAMAELCLEDRTRATRAGAGASSSLAVVLDAAAPDTDRDPDLHRTLVDAVRRYVPAATIWRYTGDDLLPLDADEGDVVHRRDANDDDRDRDADDGIPATLEPPAITSDELAMLLGREGEVGHP